MMLCIRIIFEWLGLWVFKWGFDWLRSGGAYPYNQWHSSGRASDLTWFFITIQCAVIIISGCFQTLWLENENTLRNFHQLFQKRGPLRVDPIFIWWKVLPRSGAPISAGQVNFQFRSRRLNSNEHSVIKPQRFPCSAFRQQWEKYLPGLPLFRLPYSMASRILQTVSKSSMGFSILCPCLINAQKWVFVFVWVAQCDATSRLPLRCDWCHAKQRYILHWAVSVV